MTLCLRFLMLLSGTTLLANHSNHTIECFDSSDILTQHPEAYLHNKRFGLLCHCASIISDGGFLPDKLFEWAQQQHDKTRLAALFSPEHGLLGDAEAGAPINTMTTSRWNCPVYSLHGQQKQPTPEMLEGLDILIIDLHEVGVRCFTYLSTLQLVLEAASQAQLPVIVLDHPNPLAFWGARGPRVEAHHRSFLGLIDTPFLHGATIGALARELASKLHSQLHVIDYEQKGPLVVPARHSSMSDGGSTEQREVYRTIAGSRFIPPSPNLPTYDSALAYPITVFLEGTNYSEGRGTEHPFQYIGAPWVNGQQLSDALNAHHFSGISFIPISFIPQAINGKAENPKQKDTLCEGVYITLHDPACVDPLTVAYTLLMILFEIYPTESKWLSYNNRFMIDLLLGTSEWRESIDLNRRSTLLGKLL